jgi:hypothetical protein
MTSRLRRLIKRRGSRHCELHSLPLFFPRLCVLCFASRTVCADIITAIHLWDEMQLLASVQSALLPPPTSIGFIC